MSAKTRFTADDLWRMPSADVRRELVNGEIIEMPLVGGVHGHYVTEIGSRLREHVGRQGLGYVVSGDVGFVLPLPSDPERVRGPDVAFIARTSLPGGTLPDAFVRGAPDLAVEVVSPSDRSIDVQQKIRDYLEAGTRLVWVVAPKAKTVTVYRASGSAQLLRENEVLQGEEVLPGLQIPLAELFQP